MVKEKPDSVRTYDEDGYKRRAACLCFRDEREEEEFFFIPFFHKTVFCVDVSLSDFAGDKSQTLRLLGSARRGIEPDEEPRIAAMREAMEEAGVRGRIGRQIGIFENEERKNRTWVFTFHVEELMDDWVDLQRINRKRQWFSLDNAKTVLLLHKPALAKYVDLLVEQRAKS